MKHSTTVRLIGILFVLWLAFASGCSKPTLEFGEVEGTVTLNGKPLPNAEVVFTPEFTDSKGQVNPTSTSYTDEKGHYSLWCGQVDNAGAAVGNYRVCVNDIAAIPMPPLEFGDDPAAARAHRPGPLRVPSKYSNTAQTPFRDVKVSSGKTKLDFDVKTSGR